MATWFQPAAFFDTDFRYQLVETLAFLLKLVALKEKREESGKRGSEDPKPRWLRVSQLSWLNVTQEASYSIYQLLQDCSLDQSWTHLYA